MQARGKLISLEGVEGARKSTALEYIKTYLAQENIHFILTREPGGTSLAEKIRHLILHSEDHEPLDKETELLLFFAARADHLNKKIIPALNAGEWVVSDRFIDASYAYQGGGRQIDRHHINVLDQWIVGKYYPDLTLLFDIDPLLGHTRINTRSDIKDHIEQEKNDFFVRVREAYLDRAKAYPERIKIIDAAASLSAVQKQIKHILDEWRKRK